MSSTSATGHAKNVANFETLIVTCASFGTKYAPVKTQIQIANMTTQQAAGAASINFINTKLPPWQLAIGNRQGIFDPLSKLITRVLNAVLASDVTPEFIANVKTITRKLQGKRATPKLPVVPPVTEAPAEPAKAEVKSLEEILKSISASQMGFDDRTANMDKLNQLLASNENYNPNETDLKVATLITLQGTMVTSNTAVKTGLPPLSNARTSRNTILYDPATGIVETAHIVKAYVKSVFGATSEQYKQISKLKFTYPKKGDM